MNPNPDPFDSTSPKTSSLRARWRWFLIAGCALVILVGIFRRSLQDDSVVARATRNPTEASGAGAASTSWRGLRLANSSGSLTTNTAEEIVAGKVNQFGRNRRELVRTIARRSNKDVPPEIEKFFDAIEAGRWEEIDVQWKALSKRSGQYEGSTHSPELDDFWPAVLDAYGVAEQAHLWPAQKLLDYGNAILDTLRPGMVYVGGTDPGRWIPELLNETSGGEQHVIVTQNAFADARYLDFMNTLYGDRMATLTQEDSQRAFQEYVTDAQKRLDHDTQFPDEPKQVRPGEDIRVTDGRVQVSGQVAVMAINEKLFQTMMDKNPDVSFAIEQSFPFKSTYDSAVPAGPIMEVRAPDGQNALTQERAAQSVDYWRTTSQQLLADSQAVDSREVSLSYAKLASSQAALLLARNYTTEAEQTFQLATQIGPGSPDAVFGYVNLLVGQNRIEDAIPVAESAIKSNPDNQGFRDLLNQLQTKKKN
ncbi:MAG: tetratricopeptide repeat protein [Verrucomicrobia bacterium]|nr:tetratricopeptide repeat protein [Verrucomicrobiota bacterium]